MDPRPSVLEDASRLARGYVDGLAQRPVGATATLEELRARLARALTDEGHDPASVLAQLAADVEGGLRLGRPALLRLRHRRRVPPSPSAPTG